MYSRPLSFIGNSVPSTCSSHFCLAPRCFPARASSMFLKAHKQEQLPGGHLGTVSSPLNQLNQGVQKCTWTALLCTLNQEARRADWQVVVIHLATYLYITAQNLDLLVTVLLPPFKEVVLPGQIAEDWMFCYGLNTFSHCLWFPCREQPCKQKGLLVADVRCSSILLGWD